MGQLLKESERCRIFIETDDSGRKVIKRIIHNGCAEVYELLKDNPHPFMPVIYSVSSDENGITVTEEFIEGKIISEACFTEKAMVNAAKELCKVLSHIHRLGIIHRDIKPSNILMAEDGHIRLIDFDAARTVKPTADSDTRYLGTEGFAPPEQYGFSQTDKRSDIYALGKTLECILGSLAFDKKYADIICKCTRLDPENRYSDASEVLKELNGSMHFSTAVIFAAVISVCLISCVMIYRGSIPDNELLTETISASSETTLPTEASVSEASEISELTVSHIPITESSISQVETTTEAPKTETTSETSEIETETSADISLTEAVSLSVTETSVIPETTVTTEETDPFWKYRSYYKNLDFDKAERIPAEEMEKPLLFETTNDIPMEYIIIDTASLKENKYVSMLCDYNKDGYDDIFQLSAYKPEGQDEYFRSLCVSIVTMYDTYPDFHIISDNAYFPSLICTTAINQETCMLKDRQYIQLSVLDIDGDEKNDVVLSVGQIGNYINTQIFYSDNIAFEYSGSSFLNLYVCSTETVFYDGERQLYTYLNGQLTDDSKYIHSLSLEDTLKAFKYIDPYTYMYERENDPLYKYHSEIASR